MIKFEQLLLNEEAPSNAGYLDIKEIKALYYGRLDMYVTFSDDEKFITDGFEENKLTRPRGINAYTVDTLVGRKISSSKFYAHVFRLKNRSGKFINDIRNYTTEDFKSDVSELRVTNYIDSDELENALIRVNGNPRIHYEFQRIWDLLRILSEPKGKSGDKYWAKLFMDLGYVGFADYSGLGIMAKNRQSIVVILDTDSLEVYDIVPIQKHRKDKRKNVVDKINRQNKLSQARRNRVAKRKTDAYRVDKKDSKTGKIVKTFLDLLKEYNL